MRIAVSDEDVEEYIGIINQIAQEHPILVDKYLMGKEIEVDAVCDGEDILIPGIMEHIERAGIHSGDSISVYPAQTISQRAKDTIAEYTRRLAKHFMYWYDQHPVHRLWRRSICYRSKPTFQPYRTLHQQGDRNPDRAAGNQGDPRIQTQRYGLRTGTSAGSKTYRD